VVATGGADVLVVVPEREATDDRPPPPHPPATASSAITPTASTAKHSAGKRCTTPSRGRLLRNLMRP
jgi:hypothetical protein